MKLLVFAPYYPPHMGGLETHSAEWNEALSSFGYTITVITPHLPASTPSHESTSWGEIIRYPAFEVVSGYPLPKFWLPAFWRICKEISRRQNRPDRVITRTRFFFSSFLGLLYTKVFRIPLIHIEHGSDYVKLSSSFTSSIAYLYDLTLGNLVFSGSHQNIAISKAVSQFIKKFDSRKTPIIYRGLNFDEIESISPAPKTTAKIVIATAARLYAWKGVSNTLEALHLLSPTVLDRVEFHIIGDGEDMALLQKKASGLPVVFLGAQPRKNVIALLKSSDIFVHSSHPGGGLSTSLLEALACSNAVIATPHEGANEIIINKENGLLLSDSNPQEIATALEQYIQDPPLRETLAKNGKLSVYAQFNWQSSAEKYHSILSTL